jgi:hypothetical protein
MLKLRGAITSGSPSRNGSKSRQVSLGVLIFIAFSVRYRRAPGSPSLLVQALACKK